MGAAGHQVTRTLTESVFYGAHAPRRASSTYTRTHNHLINKLDEPCWICGVRKSELGDAARNPHGAKQIETHHWHLEWALETGADPAKILADFPEMGAADDEHLRAWLDSESNMLVLCDIHHRHGRAGIHMITYPIWVAQRFEWQGWDLASGPAK
jgi:hypothetical protein